MQLAIDPRTLPAPSTEFSVTFVGMPPDEALLGVVRSHALAAGRRSIARLERLHDEPLYRARVHDGMLAESFEHADPQVALGSAFQRLESLRSATSRSFAED